MKKLIVYVLSMALIFTSSAYCAFADSVSDNNEMEPLKAGSFSYVNPFYEDIQLPSQLSSKSETKSKNKKYFKGVESASKYVRDCMINRDAEISFDMFAHFNTEWTESLMQEAFEHTGDATAGDYLFYSVARYDIEYTCEALNEGNLEYTLHISIKVKYLTTKAQEEAISNELKKLENSLELSGLLDYQKIVKIHKYITENVKYDFEGIDNDEDILKWTAYGALIENSAVCQGYSALMYRMLLDQNIDCRIISSEKLNHAWNIVKLGGLCYYIDSTWDSASGGKTATETYFLKGKSDFTDHNADDTQVDKALFKILFPMANKKYDENNPEVYTKYKDVKQYGQCGNDVAWLLKNDGTFIVAGEGPMWDVSTDKEETPIKSIFDEIKCVKFEDGVTTVGSRYFKGATNLQNIDFGNTIEEIGKFSFFGCTNLQNFILPQSLKSLQQQCFDCCDAITEITVPGKLTYLGNFCQFNKNLRKVTIEWDNKAWDTIVTENAMFIHCSKLEEINVDTNHPVLSSVDGVLINKGSVENLDGTITKNNLLKYPCNKEGKEYAIPSMCERIDDNAFAEVNNLEELIVPDGIKSIGESAFNNELIDPYTFTIVASKNNAVAIEYSKANLFLFKASDACITHEYDKGVKLKKKTDDGCSVFTCKKCNSNLIGHKYVHKITKAGNLKNGSEYDKCSECAKVANKVVLPGYSTSYVKSFKLTKGKRSFTAKWTKQSKSNQKKFSGYQLKYSVNSDMSDATIVNLSKSASSKTVKKLTENTKYYVQIRSYTKKNGTTFYSKATKKTITTTA